MIRASFDTNMLASAIAGEERPTSTPGELFRRWRQRSFDLVLSEYILAELERTLSKPYYRARYTPAQVATAMRSFRRRGYVIPITVPVAGVASHPEDDLILATAVSGGVDYLVTGDVGLQALGRFHGVTIVSPRAFLDVLDRVDQAST